MKDEIKATIDITEDYCPITFIKVKLKLEDMAAGEVLEVFLSGGVPLQNVPRSVKADGHNVILLEESGACYRMLIEKGAGSPY